MAAESVGSGIEPSAEGSASADAKINTDVEIWRSGQPTLTRADLDALIKAGAVCTLPENAPVPSLWQKDQSAIAVALEKLQIIRSGDYYADSIHVTERGWIGINCGGTAIVRPLREWHRLGLGAIPFDWEALQRLRKQSP